MSVPIPELVDPIAQPIAITSTTITLVDVDGVEGETSDLEVFEVLEIEHRRTCQLGALECIDCAALLALYSDITGTDWATEPCPSCNTLEGVQPVDADSRAAMGSCAWWCARCNLAFGELVYDDDPTEYRD